MTVLSKSQYTKFFEHGTCAQFAHPWTDSCLKSYICAVPRCFLGSIVYFTMLYSLTTLYKFKKIDEEFLKKQLRCYLRTVVTATLVGSSFFLHFCLLRNFLGKFYYNTAIFVPGFLSATYLVIANKEKVNLISVVFAQVVFEHFFKYYEQLGRFKRNRFYETLCFMLFNGYLMYLIRQENSRPISERISDCWIFRPPGCKKESNESQNPCPHVNSCYDYISEGASTYFKFGTVIQLVGVLIKNLSKIRKSPSILPGLFFKLSNLNMGLFVASYVGIYRAITCTLCQYYKKDRKIFGFIGGLCSGSIYSFMPAFPALFSILTRVIHINLRRVEQKKPNLPLVIIWSMVCTGFLFHGIAFSYDTVPTSGRYIISTVTNGLSEQCYQNLAKQISHSLQQPQ